MSKRKPLVLLVIAAVLGLVATSATARYLEQQTTVATAVGNTVLVAAFDLVPGTQITEEHLAEMPWPDSKIPSGFAVAPIEAVNKFVSAPVPKGAPISDQNINELNLTGKLTNYIPAGYRAMTIKVDSAVRSGGSLTPGSRVDIISVIAERNQPPVSRILLQNIKVLSVGTRADTEESGGGFSGGRPGNDEIITVLLMPDQAEQLALALNRGKIQVMARGVSDTDTIHVARSPIEPVEPAPVKAAPEPELAKAPEPQDSPDSLLTRARTSEARGELEAARKIYTRIVDDFPDQKLALEAVERLNAVNRLVEKKTQATRIENALAEVNRFLNKGMFEECRQQVTAIMTEFGDSTHQGQKVSDIASTIRMRIQDHERQARVDFQLFRNWLQNDNQERASAYLEKLRENYPHSSFYHDAAVMAAKTWGVPKTTDAEQE